MPNRGLYRFGGPQQPGAFPWYQKIQAAGLLAQRPAACPAILGFTYLATDVSGGTLYTCVLSSGRAAWLQSGTAMGGRELLTAARTYYVRTDGSDSNTGLANTADGAFLKIQKAVDILSRLDNNGFDITVQVADGTYTDPTTLRPIIGSGNVFIQGNSGTPANVLVSTTGANCFSATNNKGSGGAYYIKDIKVKTTTSGDCLYASNGYVLYQNVVFDNCGSGYHIHASLDSLIQCNGAYSITAGAISHMLAEQNSIVYCTGTTVTVSGGPIFVNFANAGQMSLIQLNNNTYSGYNSATQTGASGSHYNVSENGQIKTNGAGANYLPGNSAGATSVGGIYT